MVELRYKIFMLLICFGLALPQYARAETALTMKSYCAQIIGAKIISDNKIVMPQTFKAGMCWGAFSAIQRLSATSFSPQKITTITRVCAPINSSSYFVSRKMSLARDARRGQQDVGSRCARTMPRSGQCPLPG